MKIYQKILLALGILAINNLLLLSLIGYFSEGESNAVKDDSTHSIPSNSIGQVQANPRTSEPDPHTVRTQNVIPTENIELEQAIQQYVYSDQFETVLVDWQQRLQQRDNDMKERMATMSSRELHSVVLNAESLTERTMAFDLLIENGANKLKQLSNEQIKDIYIETDNSHWSKASMLSLLIENGDRDALDWAKQAISDNTIPRGATYDLINNIFDHDPEFVKNHVENFELDTSNPPNSLMAFLYQEPDLINTFLARNFDKILDAENDEIYRLAVSSADLSLTSQQQSKMAELFGSTSREKRSFAINLARNIEDTRLLRDGYEQLTRKGEKMQFIVSLLHPGVNSEISNLAKELATSSDEPSIRNLINAYQIY